MLRRLDLKTRYRSLNKGFWPEDLPLGKRTVIYGHNGSGKSAFSELLLGIASDEAAAEVVWEDETQSKHSISTGQGGPSPSMAVFTKSWVKTNLSQFLDGRTASAIVTLGKEAIESKEEEERLAKEIATHQEDARTADKRHRDAEAKVEKLARGVQDAIEGQLGDFDHSKFNKHQYQIGRVKNELTSYKGEFPDENAHAEALKRLGEGVGDRIADVGDYPDRFKEHLSDLPELLADTPTRVALASIDGHADRERWVHAGIELHDGRGSCLFCDGPLTDERRDQLAHHFDESWQLIRGRASSLLREAASERESLQAWLGSLPETKDLSSTLQPAYVSQLTTVSAAVNERLSALTDVEKVLKEKSDVPGSTPSLPDCSALSLDMATGALAQAVIEHNRQVDDHKTVVEGHVQTILNHLIGSKADDFRNAHAHAATSAQEAAAAKSAQRLAETALDEARKKNFSSHEMAETLTRDLTRVYGKHHLSVTVTPDGKSYSCKRGTEPAENLSDGEQATLSLLYFLRKLEDETNRGERSERIVVIDDPSSSLDREALFATHLWLVETLDGFGQFIVLTHDFGLLRLFINSHKSAWGKSLNGIAKGEADEKLFPKVAFFEMFAATRDGKRQTEVARLPKMLMNNTSEYAYLFSMVMRGVGDSADHERLFLLPNAVRRVLEVFTSYKAPHFGPWDQRLKHLTSLNGDAYRDVYDFCNRYSHGEGPETVDVMDARAIHHNIKRCMEFLRNADPDHFAHMCKATSSDATVLD